MNYFTDSLSAAFQLIIGLDSEVWQIVWTSLHISLVATVSAACLAVPLGVWIALNEFRGKLSLQQFLNTLMAMPTVVIGLILYGLFTRQGALGDWGLLYTPTAIMIGEALLIFPVILNLSIVAISAADSRLYPTLQSLGATRTQAFIQVISETRFAVMAAIIAGFGRAIGEVGAAMMLGGNIEGFTRTMTTAIALETSKGEFELALALGILLLVIAFALNMGLQGLQRKH